MGASRTTIEMRIPEEHRERLHRMVKAPCAVIVLPCTACGPRGLDGQVMTLVRTTDDTTMYAVTSLDPRQVATLGRGLRVTVVVPGTGLALFVAEARISRERGLLDELWNESWNQWFRGKSDPRLAIVTLSPIEGSYGDAMDRHSYVYRQMPAPPARLASAPARLASPQARLASPQARLASPPVPLASPPAPLAPSAAPLASSPAQLAPPRPPPPPPPPPPCDHDSDGVPIEL